MPNNTVDAGQGNTNTNTNTTQPVVDAKAENNTNTEKQMVERSELLKVISERDESKTAFRALQEQFSGLQDQFNSYKSEIEAKKIDTAKATGDVQALEESFNIALESERTKLSAAQESADSWKSKYMDTMVQSKVKEVASEHLGDYSPLFLEVYKDKFQLSDDGKTIKIKDDIRSLGDIVKDFGEKYKLPSNTVKSGMGIIPGDSKTKISKYTKADIDNMSPLDLQKLAFTADGRNVLAAYSSGKLS